MQTLSQMIDKQERKKIPFSRKGDFKKILFIVILLSPAWLQVVIGILADLRF